MYIYNASLFPHFKFSAIRIREGNILSRASRRTNEHLSAVILEPFLLIIVAWEIRFCCIATGDRKKLLIATEKYHVRFIFSLVFEKSTKTFVRVQSPFSPPALGLSELLSRRERRKKTSSLT